jgi:hypothetical protein
MSESAPRSVAKKPGLACWRGCSDETAIDLAKRWPAVDCRDRFLKRAVVEDRTVKKRCRCRVDAGAQMVGEGFRDEFRAPRPAAVPLRHDFVHFHDPRRRKGARKRGRRPRRKGESRRIVEAKVALDLPVRMPLVGKTKNMVVIALVNKRRIVNLHELLITVVVGQRHEQVERLTGREQRGARTFGAHGRHGVVHQTGHHPPIERGLEPARAHERRKLLPHLHVGDRAKAAGAAHRPQQGLKEPLAPGAGARVWRQQDRDIRVLEPQVAQRTHRQIVAERTRQHGAVDAAGRRACDDIDDHAQLDAAADVAQQLEIDVLGVIFRVVGIDAIEERRFCPPGAVCDRMQRARGAHQFQDFLGDAVHIDGERNAAEANERNAKFLFAQGLITLGTAVRPPAEIIKTERQWAIARSPHSIMVAVSIHIG